MILNKLVKNNSLLIYRNFQQQCHSKQQHEKISIENGLFFDCRKAGERDMVNPAWILKNGKGSLKIEKINKTDFELIGSFYNYHFVHNGNIWKAIDAKYEDTEKLIFDALSIPISQPLSYAAFDKNKLVGIHLNRLHTRAEFSKMFEGKLFDSNAKLFIKDDYAEDIANGPYNLTANRIYILLNECLKQTGKFLPEDIKNLGYMKVTGIKPEFMGNGLFQYFFTESLKAFKEKECNYFIAFCLATASEKMCEKMGMWSAFCFPYSEYKENGKPIFQNLYDGAAGVHLMMGKVDVAMKIFEGFNNKAHKNT